MISEHFRYRLQRAIAKEVYLYINALKPLLDADIHEEIGDRDYRLHIHVFKAKRKSRVLETLRLLESFISEREEVSLRKKRREVSLASLFK